MNNRFNLFPTDQVFEHATTIKIELTTLLAGQGFELSYSVQGSVSQSEESGDDDAPEELLRQSHVDQPDPPSLARQLLSQFVAAKVKGRRP